MEWCSSAPAKVAACVDSDLDYSLLIFLVDQTCGPYSIAAVGFWLSLPSKLFGRSLKEADNDSFDSDFQYIGRRLGAMASSRSVNIAFPDYIHANMSY